MNHRILVAASALMLISLPSAAQVNLNMNQITCRDWLGYSPDAQNFVKFWMSGYYNAAANSEILDYDRLQRNAVKVKAYCKKYKSRTLPTAIKNAAK